MATDMTLHHPCLFPIRALPTRASHGTCLQPCWLPVFHSISCHAWHQPCSLLDVCTIFAVSGSCHWHRRLIQLFGISCHPWHMAAALRVIGIRFPFAIGLCGNCHQPCWFMVVRAFAFHAIRGACPAGNWYPRMPFHLLLPPLALVISRAGCWVTVAYHGIRGTNVAGYLCTYLFRCSWHLSLAMPVDSILRSVMPSQAHSTSPAG